MKIIAGHYKSRKLNTLKGDNTRPTSNRLKEALFNQLGPFFEKGSFLDIFAGSGAMSFEALSRGMDKACLIEKDREALKVIEKNVSSLDVKSKTQIIKGDALIKVSELKDKYDIIFMDPPYDYQYTFEILNKLHTLLAENGIIIVETDKNTKLEDTPENLIKIREKSYGFSKIHTYKMSK
ncbi:MAG: 16S rRNA (guanine(966)-N(2))-methyltransferase RsmD [Erysipelothrix sp.]|nr:16S rRNA (guanine(966)-N(2))-methyltransferase RsmD [Erysipelothrix sp.]